MRIRAKLTAMGESEISAMLSHGEYLRIKQMDSKPLFRAYVVGHEGEFTPTAVGIGRIVTNWFEGAVRKLKDQINFGTKLFLGHGETNVHENRVSIGEIVGTGLKTIKDKLSVVAIAYIRPEFRDLKLDIASIEADVELSVDEENGVYDAEVKSITGVALGDSSEETPAFTGATLIGEMRAFLDQSHKLKGGDMGLSLSDVRQYISSENLKPSDLFGLGDLTSDPLITSHIDAEKKSATTGEYQHRKRDEEGYQKKVDELSKIHETEKETLIKERDELRKQVLEGRVPTLVKNIKDERKLDDKQSAFIDRAIRKFSSPENPDELEKTLNSFFDEQIAEYKELGETVYGVKKTDDKSENDDRDSQTNPSEVVSEMSME